MNNLTRREYFAAMLFQALVMRSSEDFEDIPLEVFADKAVLGAIKLATKLDEVQK